MKKLILLLTTITLLFSGCSSSKKNRYSIAVFVPGIIEDSPCYKMLADGVKSAVDDYNKNKNDENKAQLYIMEAGNNQSEWAEKITALCALSKYDLIISSNPSLPAIIEPLTQQFPKQKFILLDATWENNENIYTVCYNQYEQAYLTGYIAGLMSKSKKIALIAAQEYPVMNEILFPYYKKGALAADKSCEVSFFVVGNWYDANKSAVISNTAISDGVDVLLPICGGAAQGVINSAVNNKAYITWFDNNGFAKAPGTVISSAIMEQEKMSALLVKKYFEGKIPWGTNDTAGMKDGFVRFIEDDPLYTSTVPEDIQQKMSEKIKEITKNPLIQTKPFVFTK
ncbi:MAG: BMP family ABC transporter substrate-binding protein [Treponema sp.]|nr:BMP family ABC transporter substrate-binding protein [Treponema sp.]